MVDEIVAQIRYLNSTASEIVRMLCKQERYQSFHFLYQIQKLMQQGVAYPNACRQAILIESGPLCKEDLAAIAEMMCTIGTTDTDGQIDLLTAHRDTLEARKQDAAQKLQRFGTLYRTGGVLTGALLVILML